MTEYQIKTIFAKWCEDTGRSGGVLVGSSIKELLVDVMVQAFKLGYEAALIDHVGPEY